jgi:rubrerythrin
MGFVYILENKEADRVKVGVTVNQPAERLKVVNQMWTRFRATCQICGGRRLVNIRDGLIPKHAGSGKHHTANRYCAGSLHPPLERDTSVAKSYLNDLKKHRVNSNGTEKGSLTRMINNIEKRIDLYSDLNMPIGKWCLKVVFTTNEADLVEQLTHKLLDKQLDKKALFGEVFCCSVESATKAVEKTLNNLSLANSAKKEYIEKAESEINKGVIEKIDVEKKSALFECVMCKLQWEGKQPSINYCPQCGEYLYAVFKKYL